MSGVAIIHYLVSHDAGVLAVVAEEAIYSGSVPQGTLLPAIAVTHITGIERKPVSMSSTPRLVTDRVQVTVQAATYAKQKQLMALVRAACPVSRGSINGFACEAVLSDVEGPDIHDQANGIFAQTLDFIVKFNR